MKKRITKKELGTSKRGAHLKAYSFKPGDPRINRKGAPKKAVRLKRLMEEMLGVPLGMEIQESDIGRIIKSLVREAIAGRNKVAAAKELLDRMYGKAQQRVVLDDDDKGKGKRIDLSKLDDDTLKKIAGAMIDDEDNG